MGRRLRTMVLTLQFNLDLRLIGKNLIHLRYDRVKNCSKKYFDMHHGACKIPRLRLVILSVRSRITSISSQKHWHYWVTLHLVPFWWRLRMAYNPGKAGNIITCLVAHSIFAVVWASNIPTTDPLNTSVSLPCTPERLAASNEFSISTSQTCMSTTETARITCSRWIIHIPFRCLKN